MHTRPNSCCCLVLAALLAAAPAFPSAPVSEARDLAAVIALLGLPCGEVVAVARLNDNDHVATCRDGNRYRVRLDETGRVIAQRH